MNEHITPEWPAPENVRALSTVRNGGVSHAPFDSFNLAAHVEDEPSHVLENRNRLRALAGLAGEPLWLRQVHGTQVVRVAGAVGEPVADAAIADGPEQVCAILTADCIPVLFASRDGTRVAAAHAGWRGLAAGVLEATLDALAIAPEELLVWLGPAIEFEHFEVGGEVREAFLSHDPGAASAFVPHTGGKWLADLCGLARLRLTRAGVEEVYGGEWGTYRDRRRFFSHRRDGRCGRMATLIWMYR